MLICRPAQSLRVDTPVFQPRAASPSKNLSQAAKTAAVFVPRSQGIVVLKGFSCHRLIFAISLINEYSISRTLSCNPRTHPPRFRIVHSSSISTDHSNPMSQPSLSQTSETPYTDMDMYSGNHNYMDQVTNGYNQMNLGPNTDYSPYLGVTSHQGQQYDPMSDMYFQQPTNYQPLQYHLYTSPPPRRQELNLNQRTAADFFVPDDLRETLQRKNEAAQRVFLDTSLPKNIKGYHSLVPLDISRDSQGSIRRFGYPSWVYKADSSKIGKKYALRRLESTLRYVISDIRL
jgi:hypothetical protein